MTKLSAKTPWLITIAVRMLSHQEDHEQYVGDIEELYHKHKKRNGTFYTNIYLFKQIFKSAPYFICSSIFWGVAMLKNYLKIAFRNLLKHRLNSAINIFGMAVGLSVCFLILIFVQDELSYDQYHENKDRVYRVLNNNILWLSPNEAKVFKNNFPEIKEAVRLLPREGIQVQFDEKKFIEDKFTFVDTGFFELFTFNYILGNKESAVSAPGTVVITQEIATKYFENKDPIGKILRFDNETEYIVAAVVEKMPHNSHFHFDIFIPIFNDLALWGEKLATNWEWRNFPTYIMLKENVSASALGVKFNELVGNLRNLKPGDDQPKYDLKKITDIHLYPADTYNPLETQSDIIYVVIFSSIALFILLIACFNYINIITANVGTRLKEVSIKKVIGATRAQISRQFFIEAVIQFLIAFLFAVVTVAFTLPEFSTFTSKELLFSSILSDQSLAGIFIILIIVTLTIFIAGGYPARLISSFQPAVIMKGFKNNGNSSFNFRKVLVVVQYTISITLIISASVMLRQINFLYTTDLGYDKDFVVICEYDDDAENPKYNLLKNALLQNNNISFVSAGSRIPSTNLGNKSYIRRIGESKGTLIGIVHTDYDYFKTFGIKPAAGRLFSEEMKTDSRESIILNESAVKALGFIDDPLGKMVFESWQKANVRVIGVVPDFHFESLYTDIAPTVFVVSPNFCYQLVAKIKPHNVSNTLEFIEEGWKSFYPDRVFRYKFLDENYLAQYKSDQRTFQLMIYFTILAVFIASLGLFGMITHSAKSRVKEIGIRKVLGASVFTIIKLLTSEYLKWILLSFCFAVPIVIYLLDIWLQNFAYRINISVLDFFIAGMIIIIVSFLTVIRQGIKASIANPIESLKYE